MDPSRRLKALDRRVLGHRQSRLKLRTSAPRAALEFIVVVVVSAAVMVLVLVLALDGPEWLVPAAAGLALSVTLPAWFRRNLGGG